MALPQHDPFFVCLFFTVFSNLPLSNFEIFPLQQTEPNIIILHITFYSIIKSYSHIWIYSKWSQLSHAIHSRVHFFSTELMFSFQFNLLSKTTPKYLYVSTLSIASPLMWTGLGHLWFFVKVNAHLFRFGNLQIQIIFITPIHKVFNLLVVFCIFIITNFSNKFCIICKFY